MTIRTYIQRLSGMNNPEGEQAKKNASPERTLEQKSAELFLERKSAYIGRQFAFKEGTIPLHLEEKSERIFREILSIGIKDVDKCSLEFGDEIILGRDIEEQQISPPIRLIVPYQTFCDFVDATLASVQIGRMIGLDYVFPKLEYHLMGQGFVTSPKYFDKIKC
jgi:hypothetical protein